MSVIDPFLKFLESVQLTIPFTMVVFCIFCGSLVYYYDCQKKELIRQQEEIMNVLYPPPPPVRVLYRNESFKDDDDTSSLIRTCCSERNPTFMTLLSNDPRKKDGLSRKKKSQDMKTVPFAHFSTYYEGCKIPRGKPIRKM